MLCDIDESVPMDVDINVFVMSRLEIILYLNKTLKMNMSSIEKFINIINEMKESDNNTFSIKKLSTFATPEQISCLQQKLINAFVDDTSNNPHNTETHQSAYQPAYQPAYQQQLLACLQQQYNEQQQQFNEMQQYNEQQQQAYNYIEPTKGYNMLDNTFNLPVYDNYQDSLIGFDIPPNKLIKTEIEKSKPIDLNKSSLDTVHSSPSNSRYTPSKISETDKTPNSSPISNSSPNAAQLRELRLKNIMEHINKRK
jgi:hypothetical protein